MQIGVIADTHSKMRPEALEVLKGSGLINSARRHSCWRARPFVVPFNLPQQLIHLAVG